MTAYEIVSIGPTGYERLVGRASDRVEALRFRDRLREQYRQHLVAVLVRHADVEEWIEWGEDDD